MQNFTLQEFDDIPTGLLSADAGDLVSLLGGPSLINIAGAPGRPPLFVSSMLHGDEITGLLAMQQLLSYFSGRELPRPIYWFIGNVAAAASGQRRLAEQTDYNRIWAADCDVPEAAIARAVLQRLEEVPPFAAVDIHNNSGRNPAFACVNRLTPEFVGLAGLFSDTIIHFTRPKGVCSLACAEIAPSVTLECGQPCEPEPLRRTVEYLKQLLVLDELPTAKQLNSRPKVLETVATIRVKPGVSFDFAGEGGSELSFRADLESLNFTESAAGTKWADSSSLEPAVQVEGIDGRDVTAHYFEQRGRQLVQNRDEIPAMLSSSPQAVRQDCLGYFMEALSL